MCSQALFRDNEHSSILCRMNRPGFRNTFCGGKDGAMTSRYDENTKSRAVRLVREHAGDYQTEWAAMKAISARVGMSAETLRKWVRRAEVDADVAAGVPTETAR